MLYPLTNSRHDAFFACLRLRAMTMQDFADEIKRHKTSIYRNLRCETKSSYITHKVDSFINQTLQEALCANQHLELSK